MATPDLDHLEHLGRAQRAFAATIPVVDPRAPVPWCGRWRVRDLVVHLARVHHWAAAQARGAEELPLGRGPFDLERLYRDCAGELRATLTELGPDARGTTLLGTGPASFWRRRQLHETVVHLWDLRTAGGLGVDVPPEVWADTVDEVVTVMQPRQVRLGRMRPLPGVVGLAATDVDRRWRLGDPAPSSAAGTGAGDDRDGVEVRGPASALALLLWRRTGADNDALGVTGDAEVLHRALREPLTP